MPTPGDQVAGPHYHLVPRTLCFIFHGDEVLLLRGAPTKTLWANTYNGIGGHVEPGEDVAAAALREIREETGLQVHSLRLRGVVTIDVEPHFGIGLYVFTAQTETRQVTPSGEGELRWFPKRALPREGLMEDLPTLLDRVQSADQADTPFCAHFSYGAGNRLVIRFSPTYVSPSDTSSDNTDGLGQVER